MQSLGRISLFLCFFFSAGNKRDFGNESLLLNDYDPMKTRNYFCEGVVIRWTNREMQKDCSRRVL